MTAAPGFGAEARVERLAQPLPSLTQMQEPCLRDSRKRHARVTALKGGRGPGPA